VTLDDDARAELAALEAAHLRRIPRVVDGRQGVLVVVDGVEVVSFASNDYLGLAGDPRLAAAAAASLDHDGVGAGASRLIIGNHRSHVALQAELADWMRCGGVQLFNTGYAANVGVLTALLRAGDVVFSDELNHASIIDGCRLSRAEVVVYPHNAMDVLDRLLRERTGTRRIIVSESLFSMDGDLADIGALAALARRHDAALILDEAHALGAIGPEGRGMAATLGVVPDVVVGTFGKSLGTFGAFAATTPAISELLWNRARPLVFSTGLPPSITAATRAALEIVRGTDGAARRDRLARTARSFRAALPVAGGGPETAIAPVVVGDEARVMQIGAGLLEARFLVSTVRPPTVPAGTARLRISFSAGHSPEQVQQLATVMRRVIGGS
jgi:8-amino-7-oxononanoate synthase